MPNRSTRARWALALAVLCAALFPAVADADEVVAELRVIDADGGALESGTHYVTDTEKIKTDPEALCFVGGEGGSGERVSLPGPTAMGLLETAGDANAAVNPLSVTDEFGFGLGLCGIGAAQAETSNFWNLTVNHQAAQVGGDQLELGDGDQVLWHLTEFPPPAELQLTAAPGTTPGTLGVSVVRWVCSTEFPPPDPVCTSEPAVGATVFGGEAPVQTSENGNATVSLPSAGKFILQATSDGDLDSNLARVCVSASATACPPEGSPRGWKVVGRTVADDFAATQGWDVVKAKGGDDRVNLRAGTDRVNCGGGDDLVRLVKDGDDEIAANCEKVKKLDA